MRSLRELKAQPRDQLTDSRYEKFRRMGVFLDTPDAVSNGSLNGSANGQGHAG